jgi:hypothetical protein
MRRIHTGISPKIILRYGSSSNSDPNSSAMEAKRKFGAMHKEKTTFENMVFDLFTHEAIFTGG